MKDFLKAFIIGSCWFSFILFFIGFGNIQSDVDQNNCAKNIFGIDTYKLYIMLAPLYMGLMSVLAIKIRNHYQISTREAFFIIGIISAIIISIVISICHIYNWSQQRYIWQYIKLQFYHFVLFSGIIATIYLYLDS
ncbi:hypothetical protein [Powai lake megavirus]|uniref:Uncharacterized protein n=1 Tax=Powai lake megavirus TaxID=1842663 RepID=A0A167RPE9_9VIRU|nr:hypothetical protein QJ849_gp797 [Powai lake megavirus]ANB50959.1 hypothetical protein [Powai lake megavirus]